MGSDYPIVLFCLQGGQSWALDMPLKYKRFWSCASWVI